MATLFNFGGPGWFNDVFEVEVLLDNDRKTVSKGFLFQESLPLFQADETITGKIKIIPPMNRTVWHYGVTIKLESSIHFFESLRSIDLGEEDVKLDESKAISKTVEVPFEFDLSGKDLLDTYDGELFDIRHNLIITLHRPWYTFNVVRSEAIAIHNISPAPTDDSENPDRAPETAQYPKVDRDPVLKVTDCGGQCVFDYVRSSYNIGDTMHGTVKFSEVPQTISLVRLKLYKIEKGDADVFEKVLKIQDIVAPAKDQGSSKSSSSSSSNEEDGNNQQDDAEHKDDEASAGERNSQGNNSEAKCRTKPVSGDEEIQVDFAIESTEDASISPTYIELNEANDTVNVHYYIRLELGNEQGVSFWNTHELLLYRSELSNVSEVQV